MDKIYYSQADKRWANHPYPSNLYPKATIKSGGCGPTSAAMIVSTLRDTIYPNQMGDLFRSNGLRAATGTSPNAFTWIANKFNLQVKRSVYINDAVECLKRGGIVVAYCKAGGLFSTGGHIIVLADITGVLKNTLVVYDPYLYAGKFNSGIRKKCVSVKGTNCYVSVANFKRYCDYTLYLYEPTSKYKVGQYVEINMDVLNTGSYADENMLVEYVRKNGKPREQFWVHASLVKNNKLIARAQICYTQGHRYIVQVFDKQFWVDEDDITKVL